MASLVELTTYLTIIAELSATIRGWVKSMNNIYGKRTQMEEATGTEINVFEK